FSNRVYFSFFFFQAEDGIRDGHVTGVQTCALPIYPTVIGDAVNLASRLEALTRVYGVDILMGRSAAELVRDDFYLRSIARVQVKGKTEPVEIFTLIGALNDDVDPEFLKWLQAYEEAIVKFRKRDFKGAKILFSHFLEFYPDDALGKMY